MNETGERSPRHVFAVSDATGTTCEMVVKAALSQFRGTRVELQRVPGVRSREQIEEVIRRAVAAGGVVIYTMVTPELRQATLEAALETGVPTVDILGPVLTRLSDLLEIAPLSQAGLFRELHDEYFKRIEAVEFTVNHDDGLGLDTLGQAEIVLVGVSRSSKTPVSLYLSFRGWKVANVPVIPGCELPRQLGEVDARRVIGFTLDARFLQLLRLERVRHLGAGGLGSYTEVADIRRELADARRLFERRGWPELDVTSKAIEETATEVMKLIFSRTGEHKGAGSEP